jgi:hypothetical protein
MVFMVIPFRPHPPTPSPTERRGECEFGIPLSPWERGGRVSGRGEVCVLHVSFFPSTLAIFKQKVYHLSMVCMCVWAEARPDHL